MSDAWHDDDSWNDDGGRYVTKEGFELLRRQAAALAARDLPDALAAQVPDLVIALGDFCSITGWPARDRFSHIPERLGLALPWLLRALLRVAGIADEEAQDDVITAALWAHKALCTNRRDSGRSGGTRCRLTQSPPTWSSRRLRSIAPPRGSS